MPHRPDNYDNLAKKAINQVLLKKLVYKFTEEIEDDPEKFFTESLQRFTHSDDKRNYYEPYEGVTDENQVYVDVLNSIKEKKNACSSTHVFITVNPRSDVPLNIFRKKLEKSLNKKWCTAHIAVIEQRSEDILTAGQGFHAHMLIVRGTEPSKLRREIKNTFKDICDVDNIHCLNIQFRKGDGVKKGINYIKGIKKDKDKDAKLAIDIKWREQNNIPHLIEKGELKPE